MTRSRSRKFLIASGALVCALLSLDAFAASRTPGRDHPLDPIKAAAALPGGQTLAVFTATEEVALFDAKPLRFRKLLTPEGAKTPIRGMGGDFMMQAMFRAPALAWSSSGELLVAKVAGELLGWETGSGAVRFRAPAEMDMRGIAFMPDDRVFVTVGPAVRRRSAESGAVIGEFSLPANTRAVSIAVSPDGKVILAGLISGDIAELDAVTGQVLRILKGHRAPVTSIAFAPDGSAFVSNAGRFDPRIWNREESSPAGRSLSDAASAGESLRDTVRSTELLGIIALLSKSPGASFPSQLLEEAQRRASPFFCDPIVVYSPDGRYVAATAHLSTLRGEFHVLLADLASRQGRVISGLRNCSAAFTRDSKFLLTGGFGSPEFWNIETGLRAGDQE